MSYSELIKDYQRIRDYMRQFYVYGFKSREEYDQKSARSYDNERRRIESWLGDYMGFRQDSNGKQVFLSVDSRSISHNPLYQSFKAKSFTDKDIVLHFYILDLLSGGATLTTREIMEGISDEYLSQFPDAFPMDDSTIRNKLREYTAQGILSIEKKGRSTVYRLEEDLTDLSSWEEALSFFSEEAPVGVIGSYLLDRLDQPKQPFRFKHHYILHALDSEALCGLLTAMREHQTVEITVSNSKGGQESTHRVSPVKIYISSQTGRQYLLSYRLEENSFGFNRLDRIGTVKAVSQANGEPDLDKWYENFRTNLWGVSLGEGFEVEHLEMTIHVDEGESFIPQRLEREKRTGKVEQIDEHTYRFTADVYDAFEMIPWLRTFIGRIVELKCSNQSVVDFFYRDLAEMQTLYGGEVDAVQ